MLRFFTLSLIVIAVAMIVPFSSSAAGLVPCGQEGHPCTPCDAVLLLIRLTNFMIFTLAGPLALLMFVYAGFVFAFSGGSASRIQAGKDILKRTIIGLLIVMGGYLIVDTTIKIFTGDFRSVASGQTKFRDAFGPWNAPQLLDVRGYQCKTGVAPTSGGQKIPTKKIVGYINSASYIFGIVLMGLSVIMILFSAFTYITSAGSAEKTLQARQILIFALIGVLVALLAYVLPRLVISLFA